VAAEASSRCTGERFGGGLKVSTAVVFAAGGEHSSRSRTPESFPVFEKVLSSKRSARGWLYHHNEDDNRKAAQW